MEVSVDVFNQPGYDPVKAAEFYERVEEDMRRNRLRRLSSGSRLSRRALRGLPCDLFPARNADEILIAGQHEKRGEGGNKYGLQPSAPAGGCTTRLPVAAQP